jgi:polar amino acid transport system permease protein
MAEFLHYLTFPFLLQGAIVAIELLLGAMTGGIVLGFFLALAAGAQQFWIRLPTQAYIYLIRGTPMLLQLILLFNVLPQAGIRLTAFESALLALTINETAFCAEIIRGGIASVDRSQRLACEAFGFSRRAQMIHVVIPQALRAIIPTLGNEAVGLLKSTSLASVVGVNELTLRSQTIVSQNFEFLPVLLASGAMYIVMSSILAGGQWWLESRFGLDRRARRAARRATRGVAVPHETGADTAPASPDPVRGQGTALEFREACVSYGSVMVLKGISLTIRSGEVIALLGRSGSGKSTLLKAILALVPSRSGEILVFGKRIDVTETGRRMPARRLPRARAAARVGMVFQNFALFDHMTALQNAMSIPALVQHTGKTDARRRARRALGIVGLAAFADRLPHELSGGQQQRVGIARALAGEPRILLFDEPTSALDPELVEEVNQTVRKLAHSGITMLISTHDVRFARSVADRIIFLQDGRIIEETTPAGMNTPQTPEFMAFLRHADTDNKQAVLF